MTRYKIQDTNKINGIVKKYNLPVAEHCQWARDQNSSIVSRLQYRKAVTVYDIYLHVHTGCLVLKTFYTFLQEYILLAENFPTTKHKIDETCIIFFLYF